MHVVYVKLSIQKNPKQITKSCLHGQVSSKVRQCHECAGFTRNHQMSDSVLGFLISHYLGQVKFGLGKVWYFVTLSLGKLMTSYAVRIFLLWKAVIDCGKVDFMHIFPAETAISEIS